MNYITCITIPSKTYLYNCRLIYGVPTFHGYLYYTSYYLHMHLFYLLFINYYNTSFVAALFLFLKNFIKFITLDYTEPIRQNKIKKTPVIRIQISVSCK